MFWLGEKARRWGSGYIATQFGLLRDSKPGILADFWASKAFFLALLLGLGFGFRFRLLGLRRGLAHFLIEPLSVKPIKPQSPKAHISKPITRDLKALDSRRRGFAPASSWLTAEGACGV